MLPDAIDLMKAIKRAAVAAVSATKPVEVCFGNVISASPLKILVDQKMTLGKPQVILSRNVTDFELKVTIDGETSKITVHKGLVVGDNVILVRQQGGQKYVVWDRVGK